VPFIGIDVGGSFLKGAVLDPEHASPEHVIRTEGPPLESKEPLARTIDPFRLSASVGDLVDHLADMVNGEPDGVLLSGQMHGVVLVDRDGTPQGAIHTWQDNRDAIAGPDGSPLERLKASLTNDEKLATGNELRSGLPLSTLHRLALEGTDVHGLIPASILSFCAGTLAGVGQGRFDMHATDAAGHGFLDLKAASWHMPSLEAAGLTGLLVPMIYNDVTEIGRLDGDGCPIYTGVGDHQASLLGVGLSPAELSINIATGSQVSILADTPSTTGQTRPYFDRLLLHTITHLPAGRALNSLFGLFTELGGPSGDDLWRDLEERINSVRATSVRASLDFFSGPHGSEGGLEHLTEDTLSVGNIGRAAVDRMVANYVEAGDRLGCPPPVDRIALSGGLVQRFKPLRLSLIEAFGNPAVRICHDDDASLAGLLKISRALT
jgi:xylulokinase